MICKICGDWYQREDTDLCPKCRASLDQLRIKDRDRFRELMRADWAGRLVVLPCKVGDVVYLLHSCCDGIHSAKVNRIEMTKTRMERDLVLCLDLGDGRQETFRWASDKGRTWFSSKKEAEAAVAKITQ